MFHYIQPIAHTYMEKSMWLSYFLSQLYFHGTDTIEMTVFSFERLLIFSSWKKV